MGQGSDQNGDLHAVPRLQCIGIMLILLHTSNNQPPLTKWAGLRHITDHSSPSSPSSYSHFYVGSMCDDISLHVARSYTSSADSPFSLMSSFTLSNHQDSLRSSCLSIPSPLYFHYHRPPSYAVFLSSHHMPIPLQPYVSCTFFVISPTFVALLFFHF